MPDVAGAVSVAFTLTVCPGATFPGSVRRFGPQFVLSFGLFDINLCPVGAIGDVAIHVLVPVLLTWNVALNDCPGCTLASMFTIEQVPLLNVVVGALLEDDELEGVLLGAEELELVREEELLDAGGLHCTRGVQSYTTTSYAE